MNIAEVAPFAVLGCAFCSYCCNRSDLSRRLHKGVGRLLQQKGHSKVPSLTISRAAEKRKKIRAAKG